ncbi:MAG: hypothetical protein KC502_23975, partial [Myxococcales bacterium]|nr:hypothetical protein [Myxococcales bacterium]
MTPDDVTNLGFRTDLMVLGEQTVFASLGDGLLVRSPTNPSFFWGNFLLLRRPPPPTQVAATIARFQSAMAEFADVRHVAIGWDHVHGDGGWSDDDTIAAFEALGFNAERGMVLTSTAQRIHSRAATGFEIRPPIGADEWEL